MEPLCNHREFEDGCLECQRYRFESLTTAEDLRKECEAAINSLQARCPHSKVEWMEHHFAPGHYGGMVLVCNRCEYILENRK